MLVVVLAILALGPAPAARAGSAQPYVYPPQAHPYGHSYSEWLIRYVWWWMAIPAQTNPLLDHSGAHCALGQSGPVWYVGPDMMSGTYKRACTVPAGKALVIGGFVECSTVQGSGNTLAELRSCAKSGMDSATEADVTVDGVHLTDLLTRYRFETPLFTFAYPADNVMGVPGPGTTKSVAGGPLVMLAPLAVGRHTLDMRFRYSPPDPWTTHVTYHLTIRR